MAKNDVLNLRYSLPIRTAGAVVLATLPIASWLAFVEATTKLVLVYVFGFLIVADYQEHYVGIVDYHPSTPVFGWDISDQSGDFNERDWSFIFSVKWR